MVAKPLFRKQLFRNCKIEVNTAFCTLSYNLNSEPFLYLFGVINAIGDTRIFNVLMFGAFGF